MSVSHATQICTVLLFLGGASAALSQVRQTGGTQEARLSGHCQSVDDSDTFLLSMGDVRVRKGGSAVITGLRQSVYVDAGGHAEVKATGATVFVARGGQATVSGQRNHVYAEPGGKVVLLGQVSMTMVDALELQVHRNATACK